MYERGGDPHLSYLGDDMVGDLLQTYDRDTAACTITYSAQRRLAHDARL